MGYKEMPDAVKVPGLKPVAKLVLVTITGHANRDKGCTMWHSSSRIASEIGVSKRAVLDAYKVLEERGLITRREQMRKTASGTFHRGTDVITVHFDRVKASADAREDAESEGGGDQSSPGVVNRGNQGGDESSPHNRELNQEPEQVNSFTGKADALTPRETIGEDKWKIMLTSVQHAAADRGDADAYEYLEGAIRMFCGDEIADYHVCYHHTPPVAATERYAAGKWLTTMIKTALIDGMELDLQNA